MKRGVGKMIRIVWRVLLLLLIGLGCVVHEVTSFCTPDDENEVFVLEETFFGTRTVSHMNAVERTSPGFP